MPEKYEKGKKFRIKLFHILLHVEDSKAKFNSMTFDHETPQLFDVSPNSLQNKVHLQCHNKLLWIPERSYVFLFC